MRLIHSGARDSDGSLSRQGGDSIPPPVRVRGRSTAFASLRSKWCRVGVGRPALAFGDYRGRELTPTPPPPTQRGGAGPPPSGGGIGGLPARRRSYAR